MTKEEALDQFRLVFRNYSSVDDTKKDFYCGITGDLASRNKEHGITNVLYYVEADSFETAKSLEAMLYYDGFDTGKQLGNGNEDSKLVYIYKKGLHTNP